MAASHNNPHTSEESVRIPVEAEREQFKKLLRRGQQWLCAGVAFMGISLLVNLALMDSGAALTTTMYVVTTLGAICMVKGMADIFG